MTNITKIPFTMRSKIAWRDIKVARRMDNFEIWLRDVCKIIALQTIVPVSGTVE